MVLTIRKKLVLIGILAVVALGISNTLSYLNGQTVHNLNSIASVTQSNGVVTQRMVGHRQELVESFYLAVLSRKGGAIDEADMATITESAEKLNKMTSRLLGREISYLSKADQAQAKSMAEELSMLATDGLSKALSGGDDAVKELIANFKDTAARLAEVHVKLRDAVYDDYNKIGDEVYSSLDFANKAVLVVFGVALLTLLPLLYLIIRSITRPIKSMTQAM
ncbi:MAG: hypothetical protein EB059_11485, partial [Alphaproteobacteria bacterium]|nr:hypothetical protein [Alphaproteobacteria bacterium]